MPRPVYLALAVTLLVSVISSVSPLSLVLSDSEASTVSTTPGFQPEGAFGYRVGEERRYVLGPPEALTKGVMANWLIRLESVSGEGEGRRATFAFTHVREMGSQGRIAPEVGEILGVTVDGTARLNMQGFPLELRFTLQERYYGHGEAAFSLRYLYEDERYEKQVWYEGEMADYPVPVPSTEGLDKSVPLGLFLFLPESLGCGIWATEDPLSRARASGIRDPGDDCPDSDVAFANPGFLSLALATLWEAGGERSFLFWMPTGPEVLPGSRSSLGFSNLQGTARGGLANKPDWSKARELWRHYRAVTLTAGETATIAVGRRRMEATRIYLSSSTIGAAYVDADRMVLRMDLNPQQFGMTGDRALMRFSGSELWIRLLFASEY